MKPTSAPRRSARSSSFMRVMSLPSRRISPDVGASSPAMSDRSVDLPLPEEPTTATNCPRGTVRSSGYRIVSCSRPLVTVRETLVSRIMAVGMSQDHARMGRLVKVMNLFRL
jgi:hypothetical protein